MLRSMAASHAFCDTACSTAQKFNCGCPRVSKGCAELNKDRIGDPVHVATDLWDGGFYLEYFVDGWDSEHPIQL